jgi:hypothetical protein
VISPYTVIWGQTGTTFVGNRSGGRLVTSLASGTQPHIDPFCMVVRFWRP